MAGIAVVIELNEALHRAPYGHPENAVRLRAIASRMEEEIASGLLIRLSIRDHGIEPICRVHDSNYITGLREICRRGNGYLDADTYVTAGSFDAACSIVNAVLSGVDAVSIGETRQVFILGRPPGHHAERDHAMGFCLINNVAVGAQYALDSGCAKTVAVVDFDVHHGNGTQHLFYDRSDVLYISLHRYPFYPGTGSVLETGARDGTGHTINIPLAAGDGDDIVIARCEKAVIPAIDAFKPDLMFVSAGFDACYLDPLGGLGVTGAGFFRLGELLRDSAERHCHGRMVSVLEGGYSEKGNLESTTQYLKGIGNPQ